MPGLHIMGIPYAASRISGLGISPLLQAVKAVPERNQIATILSGYIVCIRLAQKPPPEWPQRHQGAAFSSGCFDLAANSAIAFRKVFAEPLRGSHHNRQFCL